MHSLKEYRRIMLRQAKEYYRSTKMTDDEVRMDILIKWPGQIENTEKIIKSIKRT